MVGAASVTKRADTNVLVFCASSASCHGDYHAVAARLGTTLALAGMSIIYGGGRFGSMGALADAALEARGEVIGIQPRFMSELGWTHDGITQLHVVEDMQERKRRINGEPRCLEHASIGWFLPREIQELELAPADEAFSVKPLIMGSE